MKGPEFLKYINPVLAILQANGGAGDSSDVIEQVIEKLGITETELEEATSNGQSRIRNQIQWARFYLFKAGLIDNAQRGIWRLTNEGLESRLNETGVYELFKKVQDSVKKPNSTSSKKISSFAITGLDNSSSFTNDKSISSFSSHGSSPSG